MVWVLRVDSEVELSKKNSNQSTHRCWARNFDHSVYDATIWLAAWNHFADLGNSAEDRASDLLFCDRCTFKTQAGAVAAVA